jgi:flagellar FliL protein
MALNNRLVTFDLFLFSEDRWRILVAEAEPLPDVAPKKKSKKPLIIGLVLALLLGGGGFFAAWSGMILAPAEEHTSDGAAVAALPDIAFIPMEPLIITLGSGDAQRHLRFTSQIEVGSKHAEDVTLILPRIIDVLNGYLRAVDAKELQDPVAMVRIRAHLLRRIQMVSGEGRVRDLLITEFVLN